MDRSRRRSPPAHARAAAAVAVALAALAPAAAGAMTMKVERERHFGATFSGSGCEAEDRQRLTLPAGAIAARPAAPTKGDELEAAEDASIVAEVRSVFPGRSNGRRTFTWVVTGAGASCARPPEQCAGDCGLVAGSWPWQTDVVDLRLAYLVRRRVPPFTLHEMRSDARTALLARFGGDYRHGSGKRLTCSRLSRYAGRCRFGWFAGDSAFSGSLVSEKRVHRRGRYRSDRIRIRNRGSATRTNEHCVATGGRSCVKRIPIRFG